MVNLRHLFLGLAARRFDSVPSTLVEYRGFTRVWPHRHLTAVGARELGDAPHGLLGLSRNRHAVHLQLHRGTDTQHGGQRVQREAVGILQQRTIKNGDASCGGLLRFCAKQRLRETPNVAFVSQRVIKAKTTQKAPNADALHTCMNTTHLQPASLHFSTVLLECMSA